MTFVDFFLILLSFEPFIRHALLNISYELYQYPLDSSALIVTLYMFWISWRNRKFLQETNRTLVKTYRGKVYYCQASVLIPARNEEDNIENLTGHLMNQVHRKCQVLVMNDNSTDKTPELLEELKAKYHHRVGFDCTFDYFTNINDPPAGWFGKANALQLLSQRIHNDTEIIIMMDADIIPSLDCVRFCVHALETYNLDFLSGSPFQKLDTFWVKLIVPSMFIMSSYVIPLWAIETTSYKDISLAIGQIMVIRRRVFDEINGLASVAHHICEDIHLARRLKQLNYRTKFIALEDHLDCNMYSNFKDAFRGMAKNVFSALDFNLPKYVFVSVIFFAIFYPVVILLLFPTSWTKISINLVSGSLFLISWALTLRQHRLSMLIALYYPLMMVCCFSVSIFATYTTFLTSGHNWRGRTVI